MYIVKKEDLVGELKIFPIEVVQKMVERQEEEEGIVNMISLQCSPASSFKWSETEEGHDFWVEVINYHNFNVFFNKYPKLDWKVCCRGNNSRGEEVIELLEKHGGKPNLLKGNSKNCYYYIFPNTHAIECAYITDDISRFIKEFYTELHLPEKDEIIEIEGKRYKKEDVLNRLSKLKEVDNK